MDTYTANLRYYIGDPLEEIRQEDLDKIGKAYGVAVSFEEITQEVITLASDDEASFRKAIKAIYERYRSPRTPYGFWGSSREGVRIAKEIADETGGGW
jgi:hypothetical protein